MEQIIALSFKTGPKPLPDSVYIDDGDLVILSGYDTEYDVYKYNERYISRWEYIGTTTTKSIAGFSGGEYVTICPEGENVHGDCTCKYRLVEEDNVLEEEVPFSYSGNNIAAILPLTFEKATDRSSNIRKMIEGIGENADSLSKDINYLSGERTGSSITWSELEHFVYIESTDYSEIKGVKGLTEYTLYPFDESVTPTPSRYELHDEVDSFFEVSGTKDGDIYIDENTRITNLKFYVDAGNMQLIGFTEEFGNIVFIADIRTVSNLEIADYRGFDICGNMLFILCDSKLYYAEFPYKTNTTIYMSPIDVSGYTSSYGLKILPNGFVSYNEELEIYKARYDYYSDDYYEIRAFEDYDYLLIDDEPVDIGYSRLWTSTDDKLQLYGLFRSDYQKLAPFYVYASRFVNSNCWHDVESFGRFLSAFNIDAEVENIDEYTFELSDFNLVKDINSENLVSDAQIGLSESGTDKFSISSGLTDTYETAQSGIVHIFYEGNDAISKFIYFDGYTDRLFSYDIKTDVINDGAGYLLAKPSDHGVFPYDGEHRFIRVPVGHVDNWAMIQDDTIISGIDLTGSKVTYFADSIVEETLTSTSDTIDIDGDIIDCYVSSLSADFSFGLKIDETLYMTNTETVYYSFDDSTLDIAFCFPVDCSVEYSTSDSDYIEEKVSLITSGVPNSIIVPDYSYYEHSVHIAKESRNGFLYITPVIYNGDVGTGEIAICEADMSIEIDGIESALEIVISGKPIIIPETPGEYVITVSVTSGLEYEPMPNGSIEFTVDEETETEYVEAFLPLAFEVE